MLLQPGTTCWRSAKAPRAALIIDMADYFDAAMEVMRKARRSIHLLNWAFEPQTLFHPQPGATGPKDDRIADFLKRLADDNPELDVRILCWDSALPVAATQNYFPISDRKAFAGSKVRFCLDAKLPIGAAHHQKVIIVDDAIAFCGGGDIGPDRWDTAAHLDDDPRREKTPRDHLCFSSRHEVMGVVDGEPARNLGALFRARWLRATGEELPEVEAAGRAPAWPSKIPPGFRDVSVGLSRTGAAWKHYPEVRENEALHVEAIARARRCIYMENQYFVSPVVSGALARRLAEPDGPEVILVTAEQAPSYFDQMTMDKTRSRFLSRLEHADRHKRLHAYSPVTTLGRTIIVHAKLTIIDDTLLRIGSVNINNRSMGFDTECDLSIEAVSAPNRAEIRRLRTDLLQHWLGCGTGAMEAALKREGGVAAAVESLRMGGYCRLRPVVSKPLHPLAAFIAAYHLGDPMGPGDSWRPWRRRAAMEAAERRTQRLSEKGTSR
jgi:phosphatidylserine/phosphatidylglycerophosphate/cardiolipin synthase-like enzyme